jgi:hypothetical protein
VCLEFMAPIFIMACHNFFVCYEVFEIINSHACICVLNDVCVLNNLLLNCNYDYDINSHFEKGDTLFFDFLIT